MARQPPPSDAIRRHVLFVVSVLLTLVGVFFSFEAFGNVEQDGGFFAAICLKVGIVLFMLWLALPQLEKLNYWAILPVIAVAAVAIFRPTLLLIAGRMILPLSPILFLLWLFWNPKKPNPKKKAKSRQR